MFDTEPSGRVPGGQSRWTGGGSQPGNRYDPSWSPRSPTTISRATGSATRNASSCDGERTAYVATCVLTPQLDAPAHPERAERGRRDEGLQPRDAEVSLWRSVPRCSASAGSRASADLLELRSGPFHRREAGCRPTRVRSAVSRAPRTVGFFLAPVLTWSPASPRRAALRIAGVPLGGIVGYGLDGFRSEPTHRRRGSLSPAGQPREPVC